MAQGLHAHKIKRCDNNAFGTQSVDNVTIFGGDYHALLEDSDRPSADFAGVDAEGDGVMNGLGSAVGHANDPSSKGTANDEGSNNNENSAKRATFADEIETIDKSRARLSKRGQLRADRVRRLQHVAGFLSDDALVYSVMTNGIKNNPISKRDIEICKDMLGRSKYLAKGKSTMKAPETADVQAQTAELPLTILTHYSSAELAADVLHRNDAPFLTSISNHIHHGTFNAVDNLKVDALEVGLKNAIRSYAVRGFSISVIFVDIQFKALKDRNVLGVTVSVVSRGEHMKQIE